MFASYSLVLLGGGSGLLGLVATELLLRLGLDGLVGLLDGGSTLDSSGAEVRAVRVLSDLVGNGLVGPGGKSPWSAEFTCARVEQDTMAACAIKHLLAVALGAVVGSGGDVLSGLVGLSLLGGDNDGTLLTSGDTDGLLINYLAFVHGIDTFSSQSSWSYLVVDEAGVLRSELAHMINIQ
jgi:hypothetical protein